LQVDDLKAKLAAQEVEVAQKNEDANILIKVVGAETEKVSKEKAFADAEEEKVSKISVIVEAKAADCAKDLAKAEPALFAAEEALNTLNKVRIPHHCPVIFPISDTTLPNRLYCCKANCSKLVETVSFLVKSSTDVLC
jgi:hypothetical protein